VSPIAVDRVGGLVVLVLAVLMIAVVVAIERRDAREREGERELDDWLRSLAEDPRDV